MQLNIRSQIKKLSTRINLLSVIKEAVVNSFQSGSKEIKLTFYRDGKQKDLLNGKPKIVGLDITDDGAGFNQDNINSFSTYGSEWKAKEGCKGIGRLCFLKIFDSVSINSSLLALNQKVSVDFTDEFQKTDFRITENVVIPKNQTTISFRKIKSSHEKIWEIDWIRNELYDHILPLLYLNSERPVKIILIDGDEERTIDTNNLPIFETKSFSIKEFHTNDQEEISFTLHYSFAESVKKSETTLTDFYCANKLAVCRLKDKEFRITPLEGVKTTLLLTSDFFDKRVNDERNDFDIFPKITNLTNPLSWEVINNQLREIIKEIIYEKYPELEATNKELIKSIKEDNLHLVEYLQDVDSLGGMVDGDSIIERAEEIYKQEKIAFKKELKEKKIDSSEIIRKASNLAGKELIEYVTTRDKVISEFEHLDLNNESDEEIIRNHFLKRGLVGTNYSPIDTKENSLWLLDDKFMTYNYVASERQLNTLLKAVGLEEIESEDRFDIGIYSNSTEAKKAILIEFKKFTANYKENGEGISQLSTYADQLQKAGINELYLYLIASVDDKFRNNLTNLFKFTKIFSQDGEIYQGALNNLNAYIQIMSPKALIADAKARNKTFIDIIRKNNGLDEQL